MYALKEAIGEYAVNRALANLSASMPTSRIPIRPRLTLLRCCEAEAGPEHQALISDFLEKIVFLDLSVARSEAVETPDGKWRVTIEVNARKLKLNEQGEEKEAWLDQAIDIGLFSADPGQTGFHRERRDLAGKTKLNSGVSDP